MDSKQALLKSDVSMGLEPLTIPAATSNDLPSFTYVAKCVESRCTAVRWFDCRRGKGKQLMPFDGTCTTDSLKRLHRKQGVPSSWKTYCNYLCKSRSLQVQLGPNGRKCECQLAENVHHGLEVFKTSDG